MCGHEHSLDVHEDHHEDEITLWIHAGATNSPEGREPYQYRYNWIEFEYHLHDNNPCLMINLYPRVWHEAHTKFIPDHSLLQGCEKMVYHIPCPGFLAPTHKLVPGAQDSPETITTTVNKREVLESMNDEEPFARLRYLFWKHLNWRERLTVLADLDVLPSNLTQPIPQIMERLALENARNEGKLKALWDAIMVNIPEDQRETNPF